MTVTDTPDYPSTVISSELCKPWTELSVMENIKERDPDTYKATEGCELNNKGRVIELFIICPEARGRLLANGLTFGSETILFRPYKGVFALLKNIPLEVKREGV